jgi:23S rRNA (adenine2503-C2)-methyltransferase
MTNIAKQSLQVLNDTFYFSPLKVITKMVDEHDETTKFLFELEDGEKIETVLMKFEYGYSICISTQVGCNMHCKFCASGLLKKVRNLSVSEMILQFLQVSHYLQANKKEHISNMVLMGIGEPFDNYENVIQALDIFNDHFGIGLGSRHITVSTCGLPEKILQFAKDCPQINLAISLHAPNDELRSKLMPINTTFPISDLMEVVKKYIAMTNRRVSFEYVLLDNINDTDACAKELAHLLKGLLCYVNIISYNSVSEHSFKSSKRLNEFSDLLTRLKIMNTKRLERGTKIAAACGQLRAKHEK